MILFIPGGSLIATTGGTVRCCVFPPPPLRKFEGRDVLLAPLVLGFAPLVLGFAR